MNRIIRTGLWGTIAALGVGIGGAELRADDWKDYWKEQQKAERKYIERQREAWEDYHESMRENGRFGRDWDDDWRRGRLIYVQPRAHYYYGPPPTFGYGPYGYGYAPYYGW